MVAEGASWLADLLPRLTIAVSEARSPDAGILEFILEGEVDLTVMATHGRSALTHFFLGSVAERVLRYASRPILTVGEESSASPRPISYENVLVAFDFSPDSLAAARHAVNMAARTGAGVQILHVVEQEARPGYCTPWKESFAQEISNVIAKAREHLCVSLAREGLERVEACVRSVEGRAHREIVRFAGEHGSDLIVMGARGFGGSEGSPGSPVGTNLEATVRTAPCPVLTVKTRKE